MKIKFRGYSEELKKWVYGSLIDLSNYRNRPYFLIKEWKVVEEGYYINREVIPETVGQFIGLTDRHKKEIYVGDVLKTCEGEIGKNGTLFDYVKIEFTGGQFVGTLQNQNVPTPDIQNRNWLSWEISGNIHNK